MRLHENGSYFVDCFSSKHYHTHINPKTMQEFYWSHQWFGWLFSSKYLHKWYFVSKIFLTYCEKNCSSDWENLFKFETEGPFSAIFFLFVSKPLRIFSQIPDTEWTTVVHELPFFTFCEHLKLKVRFETTSQYFTWWIC